ncbi:hypothetical protein GCM10023094_46820 [Rhodococcus olei]|uniref:7-cyano-7-deazaguanine synthase in queuosine biosynthesis n=1 Tax=Rhodococcus olei TaxID=2161675 RepID=A0ABP8PLC2_9NOCA
MGDVLSVEPRECGANSAVAEVSWGSGSYTVEDSANVTLTNTPTAWLASGLALAMSKGSPLHIAGAVDPVALAGAGKAQDLLASWWPDTIHKVDVVSDVAPVPGPDGRGVGCFFSGGLDSFYSAIKNQDEITHLIHVYGFDIFLNAEAYYAKVIEGLREAAAEMGKALIEIRTNIRFLHEKRWGGWDMGHGVAMAHMAHLLSGHLYKVLVPASDHVSSLQPYPTHPELDPLWSSSAVEIVYDGLEATRVDKARLVKDSAAAMKHMRVCFWNREDRQNCGRCEKCVRTMVNMRIAGAGDRCVAFPPVDPVTLLPRVALNDSHRAYVRENLSALREAGLDDPDLEAALVRALNRGPLENLRGQLSWKWEIAKQAGHAARNRVRG